MSCILETKVQAHVVEAEAIDLVLDCVLHDVVDHELGEHAMFAGGVIAAACGFDIAICIETIVVTGNYLVEDGEGVFANLCIGMVEDHVLHRHANQRCAMPSPSAGIR